MACRPRFAAVALATVGAMQYRFMRASRPIFIHKKACRVRCGGGCLRDQANFGCYLLQL
jgi:hypothetical protein